MGGRSYGRRAGLGSDTLPAAPALYLPLGDGRRGLGVLAVRPSNPRRVLLPEQRHLLETFAGQIGLALERAGLAETAAGARVAAERESLRNTLLASISHDLRTPLAAMAGAASTLVARGSALDEPTRTDLARAIEAKARDMSELVSKVLDLMRFDSGEIARRRDWESVEDLVGAGLEQAKDRLAAHRVDVALPADLPLVFVDATLVVQAFANLFDNAAKYTAAGTPITVSARDESGAVHVTVDDAGPGWPAGDLERLFDKFQRGIQEGTIVGVGLGLSICRAIVHAHGGTIAAGPRPGGGARLELDAAHHGARGVTVAMHQLLVVEDDDDIRNVLRVLLEAENYRVVEATTATRAEIEARSHRPDLLLVDLGLPDGTELKSSGAFGHGRPCRSLCSRRARSRRRRSRRSMLVPTTTSRSRSALRSSWRVCEPVCAAMCAAPSASLLFALATRRSISTGGTRKGRRARFICTPLEYRVLECLVRHSGRIVRPQQLLRESWGPDRAGDTRTLRVCIKNLRDKLEPNPRRPAFLTTDVGLGYRLTIP